MKRIHISKSYQFPYLLLAFIMTGLLLWRIIFVVFNGTDDLFSVIAASIRLDLSMTAGFFMLCFIPYVAYMFSGINWIRILLKWVAILLWIFISIVEMSSVLLFKEWGTTLDNRAVSYLSNPVEMWASVERFIPWHMLLVSLLLLGSGIWICILLFKNWMPVKNKYVIKGIYLLLLGGFALLIFRGGWQKVVITPSDAFFSNDMNKNFAATNKVWYSLYAVSKSGKLETNNSDEAINNFEKKYRSNQCTSSDMDGAWKGKNIVLLILEGWSADMVGYLYGKDKVTPFFDSLSQHSVRIRNAFSTGFRTDQGLGCVLSGVPSMQGENILKKLDKVRKLPGLPDIMKANGYTTSFVYGGDLNFANLYNYLAVLGFDTIIGQQSFVNGEQSSDWGIPDHIAAGKALDIMNAQQQPFFSSWLLLSSHAPFEVPVPNAFTGLTDIPSQYKSSVAYSDYALKLFFDEAHKQNWFRNTIFIITADHGSTHSGWAGMNEQNRFRIPMIIYDPRMNTDESQEINAYCNHFDLPLTIAATVGADKNSFIWSRNIFCDDVEQKSWWSNDVMAAVCNARVDAVHPTGIQKSSGNEDAILFLDMIKRWFNNL